MLSTRNLTPPFQLSPERHRAFFYIWPNTLKDAKIIFCVRHSTLSVGSAIFSRCTTLANGAGWHKRESISVSLINHLHLCLYAKPLLPQPNNPNAYNKPKEPCHYGQQQLFP